MEVPKKLRIRISGSKLPTWLFDLRGGELVWLEAPYSDPAQQPVRKAARTPTRAEWQTFEALLIELSMTEWKPSYDASEPDEQLPGDTHWEIQIRGPKLDIRSRGHDAYPESAEPQKTTSDASAWTRVVEQIRQMATAGT